MLVEHRFVLGFERSHVVEPVICEMVRHCPEVMFNIDTLSVGPQQAEMGISVVGEPEQVRQAEVFLKTLEVEVRTVATGPFDGRIPESPRPTPPDDADAGAETVARKIWLTIIGSLRREPFLWMMSRRFGATFKIMQSTTGDPVSIMSLLIWGRPDEVEGAVAFLRECGIHVEYGEVGVSAPFSPTG